jgi:23S rRNA (pseudouridine1915-N3)-methyltransferase
MKITVITVGKIKENYFKEAVDEYTRRIRNYTLLNKTEIADEKIIESKPENTIKEKEGEKILKAIPLNSYKIALTEQGQSFSSLKFAGFIRELRDKNYPELVFIIGGALGLGDSVLKEADFKLALSEMTLPHQMAHLFLTEQLYRAFKIINNEPYHK